MRTELRESVEWGFGSEEDKNWLSLDSGKMNCTLPGMRTLESSKRSLK